MKKPIEIKKIYLKIGDLFWGNYNYRIETTLGSCIAICMWHPTKLIGGMCHFKLPGRRKINRKKKDHSYGDDAVFQFLEHVSNNKTMPKDYIVKIFGGANLSNFNNKYSLPVNDQNITYALDSLSKNGFVIFNKKIGGKRPIKVCFDLWNGNAWVKEFIK